MLSNHKIFLAYFLCSKCMVKRWVNPSPTDKNIKTATSFALSSPTFCYLKPWTFSTLRQTPSGWVSISNSRYSTLSRESNTAPTAYVNIDTQTRIITKKFSLLFRWFSARQDQCGAHCQLERKLKKQNSSSVCVCGVEKCEGSREFCFFCAVNVWVSCNANRMFKLMQEWLDTYAHGLGNWQKSWNLLLFCVCLLGYRKFAATKVLLFLIE